MSLAAMVALDEDALICDLAEVYHIIDYRRLPLKLISTLACGLREDSRIMMKLSDRSLSEDRLLSIALLDRVSWLCWSQTKDARDGRNRPISILETVLGKTTETAFQVYDSVEAFNSTWVKLTESKREEGD